MFTRQSHLAACLIAALLATAHASTILRACVDKDPGFCPSVAAAGMCKPSHQLEGIPVPDYCALSCNNPEKCGGVQPATTNNPIGPTGVPSGNCVDKDPGFCPALFAAGHCTNTHFIDNMIVPDYCPLSCKKCTPGGGGGVTGGVTSFPIGPTGGPSPGSLSMAGCGKRPLASNARVISGTETIVGDYAWSVSVTKYNQHTCGGILINNNYVLSAAHCFQSGGTADLAIDFGLHNKDRKESWVQTRKVKSLRNHEGYNANMHNDIAVLKFEPALNMDAKYFIPACVPEGTFDYSGKVGTVTGWGDKFFQSNVGSPVKLASNQNILTDTRCKQRYPAMNPAGQICAGEDHENSGSCQGDSGGPFVVKHTDGLYYALGVVSFGRGCGEGTVYTRVSHYTSWIKQQMQAM